MSGSISTKVLFDANRPVVINIQQRLAEAQKEVTTGRFADPGLSLGYLSGVSSEIRTNMNWLEGISTSNDVMASRLTATQNALEGLASDAQSFLNTLLAAKDGSSAGTLKQQAIARLDSFTATLNTSLNGVYLFSGENTDQKAIAEYTANSAPANAVKTAFTATFGVTQTSPSLEAVSAQQMTAFINSAFSTEFESTAWALNWSASGFNTITARISTTEDVSIPITAQSEAFRQIAKGYVMLADLGIVQLNTNAVKALAEAGIDAIGEGLRKLTGLQAELGDIQQRISLSNKRLSLQSYVLNNQLQDLESVDPYEASTRVSSLTMQLETAYTLTSRLSRLTILNYL